MRCALSAFLIALVGNVAAADRDRVDRRIAKEPTYTSGKPGYALLVLGPKAQDRVWLVRDGATLYVDRNGNGDLTEADEKVPVRKSNSAEESDVFVVDTLKIAGRTHRNLHLSIAPLRQFLFGELAQRTDLQAAFKADPATQVVILSLEVEAPHLKTKGRVLAMAGPIDLNGPLCLGARAAAAPVIHLAGPLEVTFYQSRPTLRRNRTTDFTLVVGTPGQGPGTFAMLGYDDTIPAPAVPQAEVVFPPNKEGSPRKHTFHLKERC